MGERDFLRGARFCDRETLIAWSGTSVAAFSSPEYTTLTTVPGKEFTQAVAFSGIIGAAGKGDSPPFTQFFLQLYQRNGALLQSIEFPDRILSLKATSLHLFVNIPRTIQVFDIKTFKAIATMQDASSEGIVEVSESYVVFPDESSRGYVSVLSTASFTRQRSIPCHNGKIVALAIGQDGTLVTASDKGTLIRLFNLETGHQLQELRRGYTRAVIAAMASNENYRVVCSAKTVHLFNVVGNHVCIQTQSAPLTCHLSQNIVKVVFQDGSVIEYSIDEHMTYSIVSQYQIQSQLKRCQRR